MTIQSYPSRHSEIAEGFTVKRALPVRQQRTVGAWCFLDHMGPVSREIKMQVHAHPHTALQTFTWMISGEIMHRDSLGSEQVIRAEQVNIMTAGHGIAHTEDSISTEVDLHGVQLWIALPPEQLEMAPEFHHHPELPTWHEQNAKWILLVGEYKNKLAPTKVYSPLIGMEISNQDNTQIKLELNPEFEYAVLAIEGDGFSFQEQSYDCDELVYLGLGLSSIELNLSAKSRLILIGGTPYSGEISMWWNFVGPNKSYISQAVNDWQAQSKRFGEVPKSIVRLDSPPVPWTKP